jgi:hypothetical protein
MTRYNQKDWELEETLLFCCCVAGKNAVVTAERLDGFLKYSHQLCYGKSSQPPHYKPFSVLRKLFDWNYNVPEILRDCGLGCYNHRARTFKAIIDSDLDLRNCTVDELEKIPGIGMKTSRFFILHSREGAEVAIIDTHVLKHLRHVGYPIPEKVTLTSKRYRQYEQWFLTTWRSESTCTLAEYDLAVWNYYAGHGALEDIS